MKQDCLLELLFEVRMDGALERSLLTNKYYSHSNKKISKQHEKLGKLKLDKKQRLAVDRLLSAYNLSASAYGRAAYQQGFKDCQILMQELCQLRKAI